MNLNFHTEALQFMRENGIPHQELCCGFIERAMEHGADTVAKNTIDLLTKAVDKLEQQREMSNAANSAIGKPIAVQF